MLLNKDTKCTCDGVVCQCGKTTSESIEIGKELLGSFDHKIPVLETKNHEYKVVKDSRKENLLLS